MPDPPPPPPPLRLLPVGGPCSPCEPTMIESDSPGVTTRDADTKPPPPPGLAEGQPPPPPAPHALTERVWQPSGTTKVSLPATYVRSPSVQVSTTIASG